jgi:hypothetical protein
MWTTEFGEGRVCAFSDSTQFSNFSTFEAGKPEMMMGMMEWLYRGNSRVPLSELAIGGAALLLLSALTARRRWVLPICAGLLGWAVAVPSVRSMNRAALPMPEAVRPMTRVAIDRAISDATISKAGFIGGKPDAFGIFDRWILRLGCFTFRAADDSIFDSKMIVFFHPHKQVDRAFRDKLVDYVNKGGHLLILDSPENEHSTANSLLYPFKLSFKRPMAPLAGNISTLGLSLPISSSLEVDGGIPVAQIGDGPTPNIIAAAYIGNGKAGDVTAIGFGTRFTDNNMGVTGDLEPDPVLRNVYEFEYKLLRTILHIPSPATAPATATNPH